MVMVACEDGDHGTFSVADRKSRRENTDTDTQVIMAECTQA